MEITGIVLDTNRNTSGLVFDRITLEEGTTMATAAKALVREIQDLGTFIAAGGAQHIDMTVSAIIVGDDNNVFDVTVHAIFDPASTLGTIAQTIHDAVVTYVATLGYTIATNRMLLPQFVRL